MPPRARPLRGPAGGPRGRAAGGGSRWGGGAAASGRPRQPGGQRRRHLRGGKGRDDGEGGRAGRRRLARGPGPQTRTCTRARAPAAPQPRSARAHSLTPRRRLRWARHAPPRLPPRPGARSPGVPHPESEVSAGKRRHGRGIGRTGGRTDGARMRDRVDGEGRRRAPASPATRRMLRRPRRSGLHAAPSEAGAGTWGPPSGPATPGIRPEPPRTRGSWPAPRPASPRLPCPGERAPRTPWPPPSGSRCPPPAWRGASRGRAHRHGNESILRRNTPLPPAAGAHPGPAAPGRPRRVGSPGVVGPGARGRAAARKRGGRPPCRSPHQPSLSVSPRVFLLGVPPTPDSLPRGPGPRARSCGPSAGPGADCPPHPPALAAPSPPLLGPCLSGVPGPPRAGPCSPISVSSRDLCPPPSGFVFPYFSIPPSLRLCLPVSGSLSPLGFHLSSPRAPQSPCASPTLAGSGEG